MKLNKIIQIVVLFIFVLSSCKEKIKEEKKERRTKQNIETVQSNPLKESIARGRLVYNDFCIQCHMATGKGVANTFPPLANSDYLKNKQEESIHGIKYGQKGELIVNGKTYNGVMMPMGLEDDEVADVMNYINNSWGNNYGDLVTEKEVAEIQK
ncbi:c-type cytochrome [Winogradskyella litorisediminis]|uniref:C-type cytochrome n=1 Tax=Winogradskyella litorisediminis TaxID=1156618 RepID=A0ABW3N744_9FLAO